MTIEIFQCSVCKRYRGDDKCDAFPEGIPQEIRMDEHDHRQPFPGDNGLLYEPVSPDTPHLLDDLEPFEDDEEDETGEEGEVDLEVPGGS